MENHNEPQNIGTLFGKFKYNNLDELNNFVTDLNKTQAIFFLVEAVQYAYTNNVYSLAEAEIVSKSIRELISK
jgi:hypothetical protein